MREDIDGKSWMKKYYEAVLTEDELLELYEKHMTPSQRVLLRRRIIDKRDEK